jgi:hypothetical protein
MIFFIVRKKTEKAAMICMANSREDAKNQAHPWLAGNPDEYEVTPLTEPDENVKVIFYNIS